VNVAERLQASNADAAITRPVAERLQASNADAAITRPVAERLRASTATPHMPPTFRRKINVAERLQASTTTPRMQQTFRRKSNRLPLENYRGSQAYLITAATEGRHNAFADPAWTAFCIATLSSSAAQTSFEVLAHCFMPDHVHLLISGSETAYVPGFMKRFKQLTGFECRKRHSRPLWQKSYHDHVLRREEDVEEVARYIFENPVRAGLVASASAYDFSGSLVWAREALEE
jgi:putative transposase